MSDEAFNVEYNLIQFCNFWLQSPQHYMLMNNTKIVVINQMWHQMIRNDESNNFLIEKCFTKSDIYTSFRAILIKLAPKSAFLIKIDH